MRLMSPRGTRKGKWECAAASRRRPDEDRQEVFQDEKEDMETTWYCTRIWKLHAYYRTALLQVFVTHDPVAGADNLFLSFSCDTAKITTGAALTLRAQSPQQHTDSYTFRYTS